MDDHSDFVTERCKRISSYSSNEPLQRSADSFLVESVKTGYSYNFEWLGLPVIQYPQDLMALQEIMWTTKPDCIIETGVARGGSLIFYASMLEFLGGDGFVVGIDIDTRAHNRKRVVEHPLARRIRLVDGSSIESATAEEVAELTKDRRIMVCLDSNHTHSHVLKELELYAPMVTQGCYCVVFDTIVEFMPKGFFANRPWDKGNNPKTAVDRFLQDVKSNSRVGIDGNTLSFEVDLIMEGKLLISAARGGYLRRSIAQKAPSPHQKVT
jgi:cephalosporin hydroxylase